MTTLHTYPTKVELDINWFYLPMLERGLAYIMAELDIKKATLNSLNPTSRPKGGKVVMTTDWPMAVASSEKNNKRKVICKKAAARNNSMNCHSSTNSNLSRLYQPVR